MPERPEPTPVYAPDEVGEELLSMLKQHLHAVAMRSGYGYALLLVRLPREDGDAPVLSCHSNIDERELPRILAKASGAIRERASEPSGRLWVPGDVQ